MKYKGLELRAGASALGVMLGAVRLGRFWEPDDLTCEGGRL